MANLTTDSDGEAPLRAHLCYFLLWQVIQPESASDLIITVQLERGLNL